MKHTVLTLCAAFLITAAACGGGGDGGNNTDLGGNPGDNIPPGSENTPTPTPDGNMPTPHPPDTFAVCDPCEVDTLSAGFGDCLNACRGDCPDQYSECRDACRDQCDGCGTGLSCLFSGETRTYRCGPASELTTCDGVVYGGGT